MKKFLFIFSIIFIEFSLAFAQNKKINPNGYNVFYYPNGFKSSEGYMRDGKPDGYWITYYVSGQKRSEGNRKNFLLDSVWIFYNELGDTTEKITYREGKKNGYYYKYYTQLDSVDKNIPKSKELYVDDKKQGKAYYYYPSGKLHYIVPYRDNYRHGTAYEYSEDGRLISIEEYRYDNLISHQAVNRYNEKGQKQGKWIELYPNGKIKKEIVYKNDIPDGYYKEYTPIGTVAKIEIYKKGKLIRKTSMDSLYRANIDVIEEKYPDGTLKSVRTYRDSVPVGIHKFYDKNGNLIKAIWFTDEGFKYGEGLLDTSGQKQGKWILFYDTGEKYAEGFFTNDSLDSAWIYFYKNGTILQKGKFKNASPYGTWVMYYENGNLLKEEKYDEYGNRQGFYFELTPQGDTAVRGFYKDNYKSGNWYFKIGDEYSEGPFEEGAKNGIWKYYYYPEMILKCKINYRAGNPEGKFICYYKNKKIKTIGFYHFGKKEKKWYFYAPDGTLKYTVTYSGGKMIKVNDTPLK